MISGRAAGIAPSATLVLNAKVKELRKKGADIVDFGIGEPDFDTPENIKNAAIRAIKDGFTKYTAAAGVDELREAIAEKLEAENGLDYAKQQVVVSNGAKHSITNVLFAILNKGDEAVIPSPYWTSYPEMVKLADGVPVFAGTDNFQLDARQIESAVTKKTKAIIINSPNNPTGAVFSGNALKRVAEIAADNGIYVISDEIYEKFVYGEKHMSIASFSGLKDLAVVINGFSKTYAMTGWRMGYAAGPKDVMAAVSSIQSQMTSSPNSIAQMAALEALKGGKESVKEMVNEFGERRKYAVKRLEEMDGITATEPKGAFYAFPAIDSFGMSSAEFSSYLLEKASVAVVPGKDFGSDKHVRISYAVSMKNLEEGMDRIERAVKEFG